jgi:hypothetical protein
MGGPTRNKALETLHLAQNAAREAQRKADALACEAWNARMALDGGPAQPSPSIRAALNAGYGFVRVKCSGCKQRAYLDLEKVEQRRGAAIWTLEGALACQPCRDRNARAPRATLEGLVWEKGG